MKSFLILVIALFGLGSAEFRHDGKCPENLKVQTVVDGKRFLGRWYQHHIYPSKTTGAACTKFDLSPGPNGTLDIHRTTYSSITRKNVHATAHAKILGEGYWDVDYGSPEGSGKYRLLKTDYDNYAVVYACENVEGNQMIDTLAISTRKQFVPTAILNEALDVIKQNNISTEFLTPTRHTGCIDD